MPRTARADVGGYCYHAINRGNRRAEVFRKEEDYAAFARLLVEACARSDMRLLAYCLGHVINEACPDSFGGRVVQRKDVDSWYGRVFEADFTARVKLSTMGLEKAIQDPQLREKIPIRLFVGDVEVENFPDNGVEVRGHTSASLVCIPKSHSSMVRLVPSGPVRRRNH